MTTGPSPSRGPWKPLFDSLFNAGFLIVFILSQKLIRVLWEWADLSGLPGWVYTVLAYIFAFATVYPFAKSFLTDLWDDVGRPILRLIRKRRRSHG